MQGLLLLRWLPYSFKRAAKRLTLSVSASAPSITSRYSLEGFSASMNGFKIVDESIFHHNLGQETFPDHNLMDHPFLSPDPNHHSILAPSSSVNYEEDSPEDTDFNDMVLKYINQMLMEEDMEEKTCMFLECSALQATEKPFYEILGEKYPPLSNQPHYFDHNSESPDDNFTTSYINHYSSSSTSSCNTVDSSWICDPNEHKSPPTQTLSAVHSHQPISQSSFSSSNDVTEVIDGLGESPVSKVQVPDYSESESVWQFRRGVEEANKFLPNGNNLILNLEKNRFLPREKKEEAAGSVVKVEMNDKREYSSNGSKGRKNLHREDSDLEEGRSNKQLAINHETTERTEMFDMVLLCNQGNGECPLDSFREALQSGASKNGQPKGSSGGKSRGKKKGGKTEVVDLSTLLIQCAQSVAADDRRSANELLKQIKQHSSPFGDGNQRLAHYFAEGLEARLAGTGSQIYIGVGALKASAAEMLKAHHLYLAACPFKKLSIFFSKKTIMDVAKNATSLHIVDCGILYGFQWPCVIEALSTRPGGPPKLRITGIDFPQPGFRPAARVEETGRRLANYATRFNVPFEFNAIAQKWETIQIEDLKLDRNDVLVVNCSFRLRNLLDETVIVDSPRNAILNLIRRMNPNVFIHGIVNGAYNAPFFVTRFREALFHFSALFDMFETILPRELHERMLFEKAIYGREAINVISCEGSERLERPETYKQWQVRNMRAGFKQLPLNQEIMKKARDWVKSSYHKDFVIDEDGQWMLQGWKGRITYAISSWRPAYES